MENDSHRTAMNRSRLSAPMSWLLSAGHLNMTSILDYGSGKGYDANWLRLHGRPIEPSSVADFDPYYQPKLPNRKFDIVTCIYVLNVLPIEQEMKVINEAFSFVAPQGKLFIAVRNDILKEGETHIGTYQRRVNLDFPLLVKTRGFKIYQITDLVQEHGIDIKKELEEL